MLSEAYAPREDHAFDSVEEGYTLGLIPLSTDPALQTGKPVAAVEGEGRHGAATDGKKLGTPVFRILIAVVESDSRNYRYVIEPMRTYHTVVAIAHKQIVVVVMEFVVKLFKLKVGHKIGRKLCKIKSDVLIAICEARHQATLTLLLDF